MPALVTATVLRWAVVDKTVKLLCSPCRITVVVSDSTSSTDITPVIGEYLLKASEGKGLEETKKLIEAARDGLLQVIDMSRVPLTAPVVPPMQPPSFGASRPSPPAAAPAPAPGS